MSDRDVFRDNLNYYLAESGKMQKDLAEAIGARYTTVSGWTRGISYPRADAMEKIADFFGIPTSKLITERAEESPDASIEPKNDDVKSMIRILNKLPQAELDQAMGIFEVMFRKSHPELFEKGNENDDTKL